MKSEDRKTKEVNPVTDAIISEFINNLKRLARTSQPIEVAQRVLFWTEQNAILTKQLCQLILESKCSIIPGMEKIFVDTLVKHELVQSILKDGKKINSTTVTNIKLRHLIYHQAFKNILDENEGHISIPNRKYLDVIKQHLNCSEELVWKLEQELKRRFVKQQKQKESNYRSYENAFREIVQKKSSLNQSDQKALKRLQGVLSLSKEEVRCIESNVLTKTKKMQKPISKQIWLKPLWVLIFFLPLILAGNLLFDKVSSSQLSFTSREENNIKNNCLELKDSKSPRKSIGEKLLVNNHQSRKNFRELNYLKEGVEEFSECDFSAAIKQFNYSLQANKNDPEALIYLNNAKAITQPHTKIAVSVPRGSNQAVALEILRGVAQAQNEVNGSVIGIDNGLKLVVEIADDSNDPELAKEMATEFVKDPSIIAIVGHNDSNASIAAAPVYQQGSLVMITPTSSADTIPEMGSYIFRATPNTRALAEKLAAYAVNTAGKTNIAICSDSQAAVSESFQKEFTWATYNHGGKITPTECDFSAPDFNPSEITSEAIRDGADALFLAPSVRRVDKAIEVAKANQGKLTLLGNHSMNTYITLQQGQASVNGMVLTVPWHPEVKSNSSFSINASKLWGGRVNWRTAMAYDATKTVFAALKLGSTREQLQQAMADSEFSADGATSKVTFLPSGDRNLKGTLIKVQPGRKSGTGYDFVPFQP